MLVGVLGAEGAVGRGVVASLEGRGHQVRPIRADAGDIDHRELSVEPPAVIVLAAGSAVTAAAAAEAAIDAGIPVVDACPVQVHVRGLVERLGPRAGEQGVAVVPAGGWCFALGDLLSAVAADAVDGVRDVHVSYAFPERRDLLAGWTAGARAAAVEALAAPMVVLERGSLTQELAGEARRLAWFPRPVGPHHAAGIPGAEALLVPRHRPDVRTVRTYLAVPSTGAELLQAGARAAGRGADWPARLVQRLPTPGAGRRTALRWACVVEASSVAGVARAWAYGTDPYVFSAESLVLLAERVTGADRPRGVVAPAELGDPPDLLDELTFRAGARWSLARPG